MSKKCYGLGVIGCGVIWEVGHMPGLQKMDGEFKLQYVYDINPALTEKAANQTGAKALTDPDEMFESKDVDIVAILTPPFARVEYVKKACAAGKHLMLEKPMARTIDQALEIYSSVRTSGAKCFIPFARTGRSDFLKVPRIIQSGDLGDPLAFIHIHITGPYPWIPLDHWMHDQDKSGGPIFDFSIHFIEMARACLGAEAESVIYGGAATTGRVKSDDQVTALVHYKGGGFGEFTKSWAIPPQVKFGHGGTFVICRDAVVTIDPKVEIHTADGVREVTRDDTGHEGRIRQYRNLISAIEDGTPLFASELEGLRTIEILDAAERSRASGRREPVHLHN